MSRLIFANQLRGLAALSVVASHLVGVFWAAPAQVAAVTATPLQTGQPPGLLSLFTAPWLNFGPLGVAVFFLISGLVIPISLEAHDRKSFVIARVLRIFPTYIAGLALCALAIWLNARAWGLPLPFGPGGLAVNGLLVFDLLGRPSVDLVNWTLATELKFYLVMVLAAPWIRKGDLRALFAIALAVLVFNITLHQKGFAFLNGRLAAQLGMASLEGVFLIFMLIGVVFSFHVRGQIPGRRALLAGAGLGVLFLIAWRYSAIDDEFPRVTANYGYALLIFGLAYGLRDRFRAFWPLDVLAAISFPLYVLHSLLGYSLLKLFMLKFQLGYYPALAASLALVLLAATALHRLVERPSIQAGRRLAPRRREAAAGD